MEGLTAGRIVHYVMSDLTHLAAIVTGVQDLGRGLVDLNVQLDSDHLASNSIFNASVSPRSAILYDPNQAINTWHWIEKA